MRPVKYLLNFITFCLVLGVIFSCVFGIGGITSAFFGAGLMLGIAIFTGWLARKVNF